LKSEREVVNIASNIKVIVMRDYHKVLIMDNRLFNSTYIQLFIMENYDPNLFEARYIDSNYKGI